jgi:hypothetical protein
MGFQAALTLLTDDHREEIEKRATISGTGRVLSCYQSNKNVTSPHFSPGN